MNEYTVDMLPDKPLIENTPNMWSWWPKPISPKYTTEFLKDTLHHRRRTLPANGALFQFDACQLIQEIKLKETCRDNEIVCLYKILTHSHPLRSGILALCNKRWLEAFLRNRVEFTAMLELTFDLLNYRLSPLVQQFQ